MATAAAAARSRRTRSTTVRASRAAHPISPARRPLVDPSCGARHHQYEKRQSEFPRSVESDELPWHRGDTLYTDGAGPTRTKCTAGRKRRAEFTAPPAGLYSKDKPKNSCWIRATRSAAATPAKYPLYPIELRKDGRFLILQAQSSASCSAAEI